MMPRREFVLRSCALALLVGVSVFVGVRAAVARDGVPGAARTWVTVAGSVTGIAGDPRAVDMRFSFHRPGDGAPSLCAPVVRDVAVAPGGAFSARVPLDATGAVCPDDMLDGRDVQVDVDVGALSVVRNAEVNPVPYAHFATRAGTAERLTRGPRFAWDQLDADFRFSVPDGGAESDVIVPALTVTLPSSGAYLLILNGRFFGTGSGLPSSREDQNTIQLWAGTRRIASQSLPGYVADRPSQRTGSVTLITPYNATTGDVISVRVRAVSGTIGLSVGTGENDNARLIAIPMVEGL